MPVAFVVEDLLHAFFYSLGYPATGVPPGDIVTIIVGTVVWQRLSLRQWSGALTVATIVAWVIAVAYGWVAYRWSRGLPI